MGEYKTLLHLRLQFFWPIMREKIKLWVKRCAHCVSYDAWRTRMSEAHFSWPVAVPLWIIYVDIWSPGLNEDINGNNNNNNTMIY